MSKLNLKFKIFILIIIFINGFILTNQDVQAAKKFVSKKGATGTNRVSTNIPAVVRYRPDRLGLLLSFSHFNGMGSVSYSFTYSTNGIQQGAGGTISKDNDPTAQRELLFGTCSGGACRFHNNLSAARLTLTAKLSNGRTAFKSYRIKTYQ